MTQNRDITKIQENGQNKGKGTRRRNVCYLSKSKRQVSYRVSLPKQCQKAASCLEKTYGQDISSISAHVMEGVSEQRRCSSEQRRCSLEKIIPFLDKIQGEYLLLSVYSNKGVTVNL